MQEKLSGKLVNMLASPQEERDPEDFESALQIKKFQNKLKDAHKRGVDFEEGREDCASPDIRKFKLKTKFLGL
jgi:hypothetical protein